MSLEIVSADDPAGLRRFIGVSWRVLGRAREQWVPPLRVMVRDALAPRRDPFWRNADRALFVALQGGHPVGRIAAIENRRHNAHHGDRVGFFGFFESVDDGVVAAALVERAAEWVRGRGLNALRGPMSPSINHECGLLVGGYDTPPAFLTPWNPPYYRPLLEGCGFAKEKDLLGFWIPTDAAAFDLTPAMERAAGRARARLGRLTFQSLDGPGFERNAEVCRVIFNEAWSANWGFVPIAPDEFAYLTKELKPILFANLSFIAEVDGEPAGFMVLIRELNEILARIPSGRLLPTGLFKLLAGVPRLRRGRVILLGIRERFRGQHIFPLFMQELLRRSRDPAFRGVGAEASWVLEDNDALIRPLATMGAAPYKRWRIYRREL